MIEADVGRRSASQVLLPTDRIISKKQSQALPLPCSGAMDCDVRDGKESVGHARVGVEINLISMREPLPAGAP